MKIPLSITLLALALTSCGATDGAAPPGGDSSGGTPAKDAGRDSSPGGSPKDSGKPGSSSGGDGSSSDGQTPDTPDTSVNPIDTSVVNTGPCKRGIASNVSPTSVFARTPSVPGVAWWYDWGNLPSGDGGGLEFVPMIWGTGALNGPVPAGSRFVLGFNEPNFAVQSNMTPQQAAQNWPSVESLAHGQGAPTVSPGVNFCGSASDPSGCTVPNVTDPYTYLKDFFAACQGCEIDHIAVHWYNCDLPSLQAYIDGNSTLEGFVQFGKPIWLTEFCCDNSHSAADQAAYMEAAIPYLEGNPNVYRYSWFSANPIPNARLANDDGSLTDLGNTYVNLPQSCP